MARNKKIFGDSKLIIEHWSQGIISRKHLSSETVKLANEVERLRNTFEKLGGKIKHISGASNPADLGFHKEKQ
jgi:ribonuclease HI